MTTFTSLASAMAHIKLAEQRATAERAAKLRRIAPMQAANLRKAGIPGPVVVKGDRS